MTEQARFEPRNDPEKIDKLKRFGIADWARDITEAKVKMTTLKEGHLRMEYTVRDTDLIVHFWWEEPLSDENRAKYKIPASARDVYNPWPDGFRETMWQTFVEKFRMQGRESQLKPEWIPELSSWCLIIDGVAKIMAPSKAMMHEALKALVANL